MLRQGSGLWEGLGREEHLVSGFLESHSPWEFAEPPTATPQIVLGGSSCRDGHREDREPAGWWAQ